MGKNQKETDRKGARLDFLNKPANKPTVAQLFEGIKKGDRVLLSRAITLIESSAEKDRAMADELIGLCLPLSGKSLRVGISGVPGVGKSTFIEKLGLYILEKHGPLAVLAIDPSSQVNQGSILGDKTRMETLSTREDAFIRPSPNTGTLGGVASGTRETIILLEAAGYRTVLIETVGVGQSETTVQSMTDCFMVLMLPGAGDELQGIKRGIMEMADLLVVNKADGNNIQRAKNSVRAYKQALHLLPVSENGWTPEVLSCSAKDDNGIQEVWQKVLGFTDKMKQGGFFEQRRKKQSNHLLHEIISLELNREFYENDQIRGELRRLEQEVQDGKLSPLSVARKLLDQFRGTHR